eukprot:5031739-Heterocapsa_arctica.AAC.1
MRPHVPPAGRQPDMITKALGAAPVKARALSAPIRAPSVPVAQSLMTKPGFVPKVRSTTPKSTNLNAPPKPTPAAPTPCIRLNRATLRSWYLTDSDWARFNGGVGYGDGISWADA